MMAALGPRVPTIAEKSLAEFFSGERLYGDDFSQQEIAEWFEDEREGYSHTLKNGGSHSYVYHAVNQRHGFRFLPQRRFVNVLAFGAAYGHELVPISSRISKITIVEPSKVLRQPCLNGVPLTYVDPDPSGLLPLKNDSFDLVTCLGVLHHIPNVSVVVREIFRCMRKDAFALLREPTISMGDWRYPRRGLTKRERGIPLKLLRSVLQSAGFTIIRERQCMFSLTSRIQYLMRSPAFNSNAVAAVDDLLCQLPIWSTRYHPNFFLQKIRPWAVYYVLQK